MQIGHDAKEAQQSAHDWHNLNASDNFGILFACDTFHHKSSK